MNYGRLFIRCFIKRYDTMKYNREFILKRAFNVFMDRGYDSTSISVLQSELGISRGAMYRYFKGKEDLFVSVIDKYVLDPINRLLNERMDDLTVPNLINRLYRQHLLCLNIFYRTKINHTIVLNYTALLIQAAKHYDGFVAQFRIIQRRFVVVWKLAIRNSISKGEVKKETDIGIMSMLFANTYYQEIVKDNVQTWKNAKLYGLKIKKDIILKKKMQDYLYELIKK